MEKKVIITDLEDKILYFNGFKELSQKGLTKPKTVEDIKEKVLRERVDNLYYDIELRYLFSEIMFGIKLIKGFVSVDSEIINNFCKEYESTVYKRKFAIEGGKIVETEKGFLEKNREQLLNSDDFKKLVEFFESSGK